MDKQDPKQRFLFLMALGLTFMLAMQYLFPVKPPPDAPSAPAAPRPAPVVPAAPGGQAAASPAAAVAGDFAPDADYTVTMRVGKEGRNEHGYEATFSSVGAGLTSYRLLGFFRVPGNDSPENRVILLDRMGENRDSLRVYSLSTGPTRQQFQTIAMSGVRFQLVEVPRDAVVQPEPSGDVKRGDNLVFRAVVGEWELVRTYRFPGGDEPDFTMAFDMEWRNLADGNRLLNYSLVGPAGLVPDDDSANFGVINFLTARQPSAGDSGVEIERKGLRDLVKANNMYDFDNRANLAWVGAKNRFFTAIMTTGPDQLAASSGAARQLFAGQRAFMPEENSDATRDIWTNFKSQPEVTTQEGAVPAFEEVRLNVEPGVVEPGAVYRASYVLYAGPAVDTIMEKADPRLHGVVSYTIRYLDFISRWLVQLLTFLDGVLGNYGLAIIVVTIIIKLLLHPLNRKSFVSMNKMTKLSPMMKEIQKKYANDRVKMQQEMSKFYKEHGVSMAGGCLPIFLQLPIFFALYGAFSQGFSMRHAAFIPGWIQDLSKPDSVYDLGFQLPILSSSHISLLPIIYLGLQFLQMSLQPKPADPQQAQQQKMMKYMPLIFVFIFYSMPAGLVLYFTISALTGVLESWWMRNRLLPRLGLGDTPAAVETAAAQAQAGAGVAAVPSEAGKKKKKK